MDSTKELLHKLGIRATYRGYLYLVYGLPFCLKDEDYLISRGKLLYPEIAKKFHTKANCIEHCIRTVIDVCWANGNRDYLIEITGYPLTKCPSVGDFLDILVHHLAKDGL